MATATASSVISNAFAGSKTLSGSFTKPVAVVGLPVVRKSRVVCSAERKSEQNALPNIMTSVATAAATFITAHPALALVDERLSTEGTSLSLGVNNPGLGWILVLVPFAIWTLYYNYTTTLPKGDDDSGGLSL